MIPFWQFLSWVAINAFQRIGVGQTRGQWRLFIKERAQTGGSLTLFLDSLGLNFVVGIFSCQLFFAWRRLRLKMARNMKNRSLVNLKDSHYLPVWKEIVGVFAKVLEPFWFQLAHPEQHHNKARYFPLLPLYQIPEMVK